MCQASVACKASKALAWAADEYRKGCIALVAHGHHLPKRRTHTRYSVALQNGCHVACWLVTSMIPRQLAAGGWLTGKYALQAKEPASICSPGSVLAITAFPAWKHRIILPGRWCHVGITHPASVLMSLAITCTTRHRHRNMLLPAVTVIEPAPVSGISVPVLTATVILPMMMAATTAAMILSATVIIPAAAIMSVAAPVPATAIATTGATATRIPAASQQQ